MTKYLACIHICYVDNKIIEQYYMMDKKKELALIKNLNTALEGSCCGTNQCFTCLIGGVDIKYHNRIKITNSNIDLAKLFGTNIKINNLSHLDSVLMVNGNQLALIHVSDTPDIMLHQSDLSRIVIVHI